MPNPQDIADDVLMYAQALNNSGETEYWRNYTRIASNAPDAAALRKVIDFVFGSGTLVYKSKSRSQLWLGGAGWLIIKIFPDALDSGGRDSPVLIAFNRNSKKRKPLTASEINQALSAGRKCGEGTLADLDKLLAFSRRPLWVIRLYAFFIQVFGGLRK